MEKSKKDEQWAEAKRRCRLNAESIKKAKELGLHPLILIKNIPNKNEQWKVPVSQWIENQYEERKEEVEKRKRVKEKAIRREASKAEKLKADSEKIKYGCLARYTNPYKQEVIFAQMNGFEFTQIWYDNQGLYVNKLRNENVKNIKNHTLPSIVHAVMDINDFDVHLPILKNILKQLKNKEIIIHPVCQSEEITENSIKKLSERMKQTIEFFENKVKIYIENNSKLDPIFHTKC